MLLHISNSDEGLTLRACRGAGGKLPKYVRRMAPQDGTFYIVVIHSPQLMPYSKQKSGSWMLIPDTIKMRTRNPRRSHAYSSSSLIATK